MGYTFASLERELGLAQGSIRRWDSSLPACDKLYKMAMLVSVTMEYLLFDGDDIPSQKSSILSRLSDKAIDVAEKWDELDHVQKTIIKGRVYEAHEMMREKKEYSMAKSG